MKQNQAEDNKVWAVL